MDFQNGFTFSEAMIRRSLMKVHKVNFKSNNFKVLANQTTIFKHGLTFKAIIGQSLINKSTFPLVPATWIIFKFEIASSNSSIYQINTTALLTSPNK